MSASPFLPLIKELQPVPDAEDAFLRLCRLPHCIYFDSARRDEVLGRYSFLAADPFDYFEVGVGDPHGLRLLEEKLAPYVATRLPNLPPFQGGAAGLLSYDLGQSFERIPKTRFDEFQVPAMAIGLFDVVLAIDHSLGRAWMISQGFPETDPDRRYRRAAERLAEFERRLLAPRAEVQSTTQQQVVSAEDLAPQSKVHPLPGLTSNFSRADYLEAVAQGIEYIRAGDIFQVNLAQRLLYPAQEDAVALYIRLRRRNAATFAGYFRTNTFEICSASPERFLQAVDGQAEARPIKGTRGRTFRPEADLFAGDELRESEKDRAENVMIVDLLRNDLSRVCLPESVRVWQLCKLELYEFVQHLVSSVCGTLKPGLTSLDLLKAAFPGGSITGAPKVRAMEIIAELEPSARGPYCGSLAYIGFDGTLDSSILIRTITAGRGWWQAPVGGGIVVQSSPEKEYKETWDKAEGLLRALVP